MGKRLLATTATAVLTVGVAFTLLEVVLPAGGGTGTYATASAAIVIAVAIAGLQAGLIAAVLGCALAAYLHLPPLTELHIDHANEVLGLILFGANGLVVAGVASRLGRRMTRVELPGDPQTPTEASATEAKPLIGPVIQLQDSWHSGSTVPLVEQLTPREVEVLALVTAGRSNSEIANRLFVSENTVKTHMKNIHGKLGVTSRTQAVVRGLRLGVVSLQAEMDAETEAA